jgi:hypothetical protein
MHTSTTTEQPSAFRAFETLPLYHHFNFSSKPLWGLEELWVTEGTTLFSCRVYKIHVLSSETEEADGGLLLRIYDNSLKDYISKLCGVPTEYNVRVMLNKHGALVVLRYNHLQGEIQETFLVNSFLPKPIATHIAENYKRYLTIKPTNLAESYSH